jgi:glycosyltransferase involved in cell wall biosynthesis
MIVVNDGSTDDTGALAEAFAEGREDVRVLHHQTNFNSAKRCAAPSASAVATTW